MKKIQANSIHNACCISALYKCIVQLDFKRGVKMATRVSVDQFIHRAEQVCEKALKQLDEAKKQEHYNIIEYNQAQQQLNEVYSDIEKLMMSSNKQQKERLYRMQLQIGRIQNDMILDEQDLMM